jgi:hypothetical protein
MAAAEELNASELSGNPGAEERHLSVVPDPETVKLLADLALWRGILDESAPFMQAKPESGAMIAKYGERYPDRR